MERRSSRLAAKRKQEEIGEEHKGATLHEGEEGTGKGRGRGKGKGSGRGRGRGRATKKAKEEEEVEEGEEGETAKRPRRAPRGRKTPAQDATGTKKEKRNEEEGENEERRKEREMEEAGLTEEEGEGDIEHTQEEGQEEQQQLSLKARGVKFLEKGHIYFFYRPRVGLEESHDMKDVQRLYILLSTKRTHESPHEERSHRLIMIPKKTLPGIDSHERRWGIITKVTHHVKDVHSFLQDEHYHTETRGEREIVAARPIGEGFYSIINHNGHTHLAYVLEQPTELGEVQHSFKVAKEGSYIIHVKNPKVASTRQMNIGPSKAEFPRELSDLFGKRRWAPVDPPAFLNTEKAELLFIGASDDLVEEFGKRGQELEELEKKDMAGATKNKLFQELRLSPEEFPPDPLLKGTWA